MIFRCGATVIGSADSHQKARLQCKHHICQRLAQYLNKKGSTILHTDGQPPSLITAREQCGHRFAPCFWRFFRAFSSSFDLASSTFAQRYSEQVCPWCLGEEKLASRLLQTHSQARRLTTLPGRKHTCASRSEHIVYAESQVSCPQSAPTPRIRD